MNYKRIIASVLIFAVISAMVGCNKNKAENTEQPELPIEASDENSITFDDDEFSFASIICDDDYSSNGELSVVEVEGNKMLKYTDSGSSFEDETVQKISINASQLIGAENLDKVYKIEFDLYADATAEKLKTDSGAMVKAPGWIGGGGGTALEDETWYEFAEFAGEEYNYDRSTACHIEFKFLLAESGKQWSNDMENANFLIMRWGLQNDSNTYIDNITFYDFDGKSIPIIK